MSSSMIKLLGILILVHGSKCLHPRSALYQEIFTYHNATADKAQYAYEVVDKIYGAFRTWFFTIIFCDFTYFENRILKYTETKNFGYPVLLLSGCPSSESTKVKPRIDKHGATAYIVTSDELSLEVNDDVIGALIRTGVFKPRSPLIFVIKTPVEVDSYFYHDMQQHFELLWSRSITNSVLIVWNDKLRMYTYNAFLKEVKDVTDVINVGQYINRQYNNLYGHQLRLSVFRKIFLTNETGPVKCDSRLAKTVLSFLNASCLPLMPRDGNTVGDLLDNGTATGVTGDLIDGYTDLELNSRILKNTYYGYIDTTYPLTNDELCFLMKKAERQSTFTSVLQLMSTGILLLCLFTVILLMTFAIVTWKLEGSLFQQPRHQTSGSMIMDLVKCFLKQTADIKFLGPAFRLLIFIIITYALIINCVIDGTIFSALSYPRYKPDINTLNDLMNSNLTFGVHTRNMNIFKNSISENVDEILRRTETFNDKKFKEAIEKRQFQYALLLRKTDALYITRSLSNMVDGRPIFHTVLECPVPCSIVYGLRYGSPYLPRISYLLYHLSQAGILDYWSRTDDYSMNTNVQKLTVNTNSKDRKALGIGQLEEVLYVWMLCLFLSVFVFLLEIIWKKYDLSWNIF